MVISQKLTSLMNASRHMFGGNDKLSIDDLTTLLSTRSNSYVVGYFSNRDLMNWSNDYNIGIRNNKDNSFTIYTTSDSHDARLYYDLQISQSDDMTAYMVARLSDKCSADSISFTVGPYNNSSWCSLNTKDWKLYRIPLGNSTSSFFSLYPNPGNQAIIGDIMDVQFIAVVDSIQPNMGGGS